MPTTGSGLFPYPNSSAVPDVPADILLLAQRIDLIASGWTLTADATTRAALVTSSYAYEGLHVYQIDTGVTYVYRSSAWVLMQNGSRIIPTAATNGTVSGTGVVTSTAQSLVRVRDAFPSGFSAFRVAFDLTMSGAAGPLIRFAVDATDAATAYDYQRTTAISTTVATVQDLNQTSGSLSPIGIAAARHVGEFLVSSPNVAVETIWDASSTATPNPMTTSGGKTWVGGQHRTATPYNSFTVFGGAGNVTVNRLTVEGVA